MIISCRVPEFMSSILLIAFLIHSRHSVSSAMPIQVPADAAASSMPSFASPPAENAQFRAALRLSTSIPSALGQLDTSTAAPCLNKSPK